MHSTVWNRFVRVGALVSLAAFALASVAGAEPAPRPGRRALNLFASSGLLLEANRLQCGIDNVGQVCVAFSGSPVGGGGFWPKGTPDQYIFNSGLQLAGIVDPAAGFDWAGDTSGAFFFDPRGDQGAGDALGSIYNSLDPADLDAWPNGAMVRDTSIYSSVLIGQKRISDGDSWVRYWEGNPVQLGGRAHPMGIMVEQRSMAWNFPVGNEDILYFVFTFYNVTARTASKYTSLDPAIQGEVAAIGTQFQDLNETKFGIQIPDTGYTITNLYAAFAMDADVAVFRENYSTAVLPFNLGTTYSGTFLPEVGWRFPSDIFGPPFFPGAGFVGVKYLKSPESSPGVEIGLTMFSNTTNSAQFPDAVGDHKLYRRLSGFLGAGDETCTFTDPAVARERRLCFLAQAQDDARFYQASGPFNLEPGEAQTIVVAYIHAAPVQVAGVVPGADEKPGIPFTGDSIAADEDKVRRIDRVMGWVSHSDDNSDNIIGQDEVVTTPRSLLNKALVAQSVFNAKFLLPNAPSAPPFYLVPGDNQTTVVWQQSATETTGDLYYAIASEPFNPDGTRNALYDPNFRQFDVEGYRIYRGRTSSELQLLAQFDYAGKTFVDFTGSVQYGDLNGDGLVQCAPELGLQQDCPVTFDADTVFVKTTSFETETVGTLVQVKPGERIELRGADTTIVTPGGDSVITVKRGSVLPLIADTAVTGGGSGFPALEDNGVSFAFVDNAALNGFTYHYAVTAFDVNSTASGPSSLESARVTKTVTPRASTPSETQAQLVTGLFGDDDVALDPTAPWSIDAATGEFSGAPPPTNALEGVFAPLVPQLLPELSLVARIDSLTVRTAADGPACPALNGLGFACYLLHATITKDGVPQTFTINEPWPVWSSFGEPSNLVVGLGEVPVAADSASAARFGVPAGFSQFNATVSATLREYIRFSSFEGQASRRGLLVAAAPSYSPGGSRWFSGSDESTVHPGLGIRVGHLPGVDTVWAPIHHTDFDPATAGVQQFANSAELQCFGYAYAGLGRQADVVFTWGAGGQITSVRDVTHHVPEQFKPTYQASYGFVGDFNGNGYIDVRDFNYVEEASQWFHSPGGANAAALGCAHIDPGPGGRGLLQQQPVMLPVSVDPAATAGTESGTGFGLYINGERYIFRLTGGTAPAANTTWTLRTYAGLVRSSTASITGPTPSGYAYTATDRNPIIPGLEVRFLVDQPTTFAANSDSGMSRIHTLPDPYYVSNALETTANQKVLQFVNLPMQAVVRVYSLSGVLVNVLTHNDQSGGGLLSWDLRNRNNQFVASGVYFYHVETPDGKTKVGRFTIVNFAP